MANDIGITWTSDQKQLIADMQKRQLLMEQEIARFQKLAGVGKTAAVGMVGGYKDVNAQLDRLGRLADTAFKKPVSAMDAHLSRLKELRVLYRMGKIDIEQFNAAAAASLKQRYADSGMNQRLADQKKLADSERALAAQSLAEQKEAAKSLALQKATAQHEAEVKARADAAQSLAQQKAAAQSLHLQKITAIEDERQRNKSAADQVRRSLMSERELARAAYRERMQQLQALRQAGTLSQQEYQAAAQKALATWQETSKIDMSKVWGMVPGQLSSVLTLTAAVSAGISVVRAEFDNLKAMQDDAKGATMTYAEARSQAVQNLGLEMTGDEFDKWTQETSKKTGQSRTFLARAASGALSAKGGRTSQQALADLTEMIPLERYNPEELKESAAGVMQQLNVEKAGTTRKQVMGQQMAAKIASRVESSRDFAGHVTKTAVGASAFGDTSRDVYSIAAYLANASGDRTGQTSASGTIDLEADLQILSSGVESGSLGMGPIKGGLGKNTRERLKAIAQDPRFAGLRDRLLGENEDPMIEELFKKAGRMTARAQNYGAIRQLYKNDPTAMKNFEAAYEQIPELGPDAEKFVDKAHKDLASPEHQVAVQAQTNAATAERLQIANNRAARIAAARKGLQESLQGAGVGWLGQTDAANSFNWNTWGGTQDPERVQARLQRGAASALRRQQANAASDADRETMEKAAKSLEESAAAMERMADQMNQLVQQQAGAPPLQVNVNVPGAAGEKPGQPAAGGLQGGKL